MTYIMHKAIQISVVSTNPVTSDLAVDLTIEAFEAIRPYLSPEEIAEQSVVWKIQSKDFRETT